MWVKFGELSRETTFSAGSMLIRVNGSSLKKESQNWITESSSEKVNTFNMSNIYTDVFRFEFNKKDGLAIRCIME